MQVSMTINGALVSLDVEPRTLLVHYLRDHAGLTGTNVGCDTSSCGACTVHLDGEAVKSCTMFAVQADDCAVTTIEGLSPNAEASMSKLYGTELTQRVAQTGMELLGMAGQLSRGSRWAPLQGYIQRAYLGSPSATIAAGTSEIQRDIIARRGLGLPRG